MSDVPQTDVSRPSALPTATLGNRANQSLVDQNSVQYLDAIEEEWNKKVDVEVDTLVDGMVDLVSLASVRLNSVPCIAMRPIAWTRRLATRTNSASHRRRFRRNAERNQWCVL